MATNTTNYNLVKPGYSDTADIADINGNMDIIDGRMKTNADGITALNSKLPAIVSITTGSVNGNSTVYLPTGANKHCLLFIQRRDAGGGIYGAYSATVTPFITIPDMTVELYNNNTELKLINSSSVTRTYLLFALAAV